MVLVGLALAAFGLSRIPRGLFVEAAGGAIHGRRSEVLLAVGLFVVGVAAFEGGLGGYPWAPRLVLAGVLMAMAAIVYSDLRFLIIPDLYSVVVGAAALIGPLSLGLVEAALGAAVCGGLLAVVAWVWKRRTAIDGLGFGDVKLAAAIGGLLGAERGLWAITVSAAGGALLGFLLSLRRKREGPMLFPYGVPLALAGAGFLLWRLR